MLLLWLLVALFSASDAFRFVSSRTSPLAAAGNRVATPRHMLMKGGADVLPKDKLLAQAIFGGVDKETAVRVLDTAADALKTWELRATDFFLTPPEYTVMLGTLEGLVDLQATAWGGHPEAERRRLFFAREGLDMQEFMNDGVIALDIGGQFMFDAADHRDFLGSVLGTGLERSKIGDILVQGERGAQLLCHNDVADYICSNLTSVRTVTVKVNRIPLEELKVSAAVRRQVTSVEASLRLDSVASAGMGMSRSKMADAIKEAKSSSANIHSGDVITIRGKGRVEILEIYETKKERYRIVMNRIS
eukprot:1785-Heterococcus_DN1.PRE.8